jgi:hypothetical protein
MTSWINVYSGEKLSYSGRYTPSYLPGRSYGHEFPDEKKKGTPLGEESLFRN